METRQLISGFILKTSSNLTTRSYARQTCRQFHRLRPVTSTKPFLSLSAPLKRSIYNPSSSEASRNAATSPAQSGSGNDSFRSINLNNTNTPPSQFGQGNRANPPPGRLSEVDNILKSLNEMERKPISQTPPAHSGVSGSFAGTNPWGDMKYLTNMFDQQSYGGSEVKKNKQEPELRLSPSLGRTVAVDHVRGFDAARAIGKLESLCAANKVRIQEKEQRFHIRRGQMRKNLRSRRWRATFKFSFQKTIERCMQLRRQGW